MKYCTGCHHTRFDIDFHVDRHSKSGLASRCKQCVSAKTAAWAKANRTRKNKTDREWKARNRQKDRARGAVRRALAKGLLVRPPACECCGTMPTHDYECKAWRRGKSRGPCACSARRALEAHHVDYAKPLEVKFLCKRCHAAHHSWGTTWPRS